jgi:hypothetical protein
MKWIVIAILACIIPYTWVTLKFRKEGPAHQPFQDAKERAEAYRLEEAGFTHVRVPLERPVDLIAPPRPHAVTTNAPAGLPARLREALIDQPLLPVAVTSVQASTEASAAEPYRVILRLSQRSHHEESATAGIYVNDDQILLVPHFDSLAGPLLAHDIETVAVLTVPAGTFEPGTYQAILVGAEISQTWTVTIR